MSYLDWSIGGLIPSWIANVKWGFGGASSGSGSSAGRADSTVTLHCATTTRDEIEAFKALMTPVFTNTNLLNGGTDLQVTPDGHILVIVNGPYTWSGIISSVQFEEDEYATVDGDAAIEFDIILELQRGAGAYDGTSAPAPVVNNCIQITQGFQKPADPKGISTNLGTFSFQWDGTGDIYIAGSCQANPSTDLIWTDDEIVITNAAGTIITSTDANYPGVSNRWGTSPEGCAYSPDVNITSLLSEGNNEINIVINDLYGNLAGCSPLFFVQVGGSGSGLSPGQTTPSGPSTYTPISTKVSAGFRQAVDYVGQNIVLGQVAVNWDGNGKVYLASAAGADPTHDLIWLDDQVYIQTTRGTITQGYHDSGLNVTTGPDIEITSLLSPGNNTVLMLIEDVYGTSIGCSSLYLIQVDS